MTTNTTTHTVRTRRTRDGAVATAELTLDWTDVTPEHMRELATKTIIIKWQQPRTSCATDAELDKQYAGKHSLRVADIEWGRKRGPRDPMAAARKALAGLTSEQLAELGRSLPGGGLFDD